MKPENRKIKLILYSLLPVFIIILCSFFAADSIQLSYKLLPGQVFRLRVYSAQQITQTMNGKEQIIDNESRIDYIFRVINGNKTEFLLDMQLDSIWLKMNISGEKVEGNSFPGQLKPGILSRSLTEISKKHLKVHLLPTGDIGSVTDADTSFHAVIDSYKQVPEQVRTELMEALDQKFGTDAFRIELQNILAIFSPKSVKSGGHWENSLPLSAGLPGITKNNWTLNNISPQELSISSVSKITPPAKNDFQKMNGIQMKYSLNGNKQADYKVDAISGWLNSATITEEISGTVSMQGSKAMPEGISWPISIHWRMEAAGARLR